MSQQHIALPLVGVSADCKTIDGQPFHAVGEKYLTAIALVSGVTPLIVPALESALDVVRLVATLDGLFLTGSLSNVHPDRYGVAPEHEHPPYDLPRDRLTLSLIHQALEQEVPLLAVCRGFQELNVALGGSLHPAVHDIDGRLDHRQIESADLDVRYGLQHEVSFIAGGCFAGLAGTQTITVNSLHRQAIDDLAPDLVAEGVAPDGTIEAVSVKGATQLALGVQWHPEYKPAANAFSVRLFEAFGDAVRQHHQRRQLPQATAAARSATESHAV